MPGKKKRVKSTSAQEEQLRLLKQILTELQILNVTLSTGRAAKQVAIGPDRPLDDSGDDEGLEEYE